MRLYPTNMLSYVILAVTLLWSCYHVEAGQCDSVQGKTTCITEDLLKMLMGMNKCSCKSHRQGAVFFAFLKATTTFAGNDVLKFDEVTTNIGGAYKPGTGIFTAPQGGVYMISCVMMGASSSHIHYYLYKNNNMFSKGFTSRSTVHHASPSTNNWIVELEKGDQVYIKHRISGRETVHGGHHSYFSGFLIQ
ncbi:complement C1q-like protein 3 [Mytilus californianus]|uniref:complement C1q-like protein 3 n=1 Tax=Mytilus californianus TaxID=6549 RepID=UPI0022471B4A|nr:complement C1q-like protein 3 [Mytilus californianus]